IWGTAVLPGSPEFKREMYLRYGLIFESESDELPIGLVETRDKAARGFLAAAPKGIVNPFGKAGITVSCQFCHSSRISGRLYAGAPNVFADLQRFVDDMNRLEDIPKNTFFRWNPPRNSFVNSSDYSGRIAVFV